MSISGFPKTAVYELKQGGADVSSSNPLPVGGKSVQKSASFTRPADTTAYVVIMMRLQTARQHQTLLSFANCANANGGRVTLSKHGY